MAANASVKVSANSSAYQKAMQQARNATKELASEYKVAAAQAKVYGTASTQLKTQQAELTAKIEAQKKITALHHSEVERLSAALTTQQQKQASVAEAVEKARAAYEKAKKETGENSEETQKLKGELEQLEQQQRAVGDEINSTEGRLSRATVAENNSKAATIELEGALRECNQQLRDNGLDKFAAGLDKVSAGLDKAQRVANVVSGAVVGVGVAAFKQSTDFETAFAKTSTIMDEQEVGYDEMRQAIIDLSNDTGVAATQIADDVYNAISAGQSTGDAIEFLRANTDLARAGFADTADTLDLLTTILNAYGDKAYDINTISDMLIQTQNKGKTTVGQLASAMGQVIPIANSTNTQLDQLGAAYAVMTAGGMSTAQSTTYLRSMLNELSKSGTTASDTLKDKTGKTFSELMADGWSLGDVLGVLQQAATDSGLAMNDMFGSQEAGTGAMAMLKAGVEGFNEQLDAMRGSTGATADALSKLDTTDRDISITINQVKNDLMLLGDALKDRAQPYIEKFGGAVEQATAWLKGLDDEQLNNIVNVGLMVAALAPAVAGINGLVKGVRAGIDAYKGIRSGIDLVKNALTGETAQKVAATAAQVAHTAAQGAAAVAAKGMAAAQGVLNAVMNANPIMLVVTAIAALVAGLVLAYNKSETFRNIVNGAFNAVKDTIGGWIASAGEAIGRFGEKLTEIKNNAAQALENVKTSFSEKWAAAKATTANRLAEIKTNLSSTLQFVHDNVRSKLDEVRGNFEEKWGAARDAVSNAMNAASSTAQAVLGTIRANTASNLANIKAAYDSHGGGVRGTVAATMTAIQGYYSTAYDTINTLTGGRLGAVVSTMRGKLEEARSAVSGVLEGIRSAFENKLNAARDAVDSAISRIKGLFNFSWSLPPLKLPHISISGGFSLSPPSVPKFSISWYAGGGIMTDPTIFGLAGRTALAGGEAGPEAILPLQPFYNKLERLLDDRLAQLAPAVYVTLHAYMDGDEIATKTAARTEAKMASEYKRRR